MRKLEITLGSLRQSQLWLSNSLRLLAESVNTDHNERDLLVYEVREKVQSMGWRLSALEERSPACRQTLQRRRNKESCATAKSPIDLMPSIFDCWLWKASNRDMEPLASLPPQNCDRIFVINCSAWPRC